MHSAARRSRYRTPVKSVREGQETTVVTVTRVCCLLISLWCQLEGNGCLLGSPALVGWFFAFFVAVAHLLQPEVHCDPQVLLSSSPAQQIPSQPLPLCGFILSQVLSLALFLA